MSAQAQTSNALAGAYTINSAQATGGTNFASFTEVASRLNQDGVAGPVTFAVTGGPYNEQFLLNTVPGASATNTIVVNGGGRTIQFASNDTNQRAVITLNGTDYFTLNNLAVNAAGGTYGYGILLTNSADNNRIINSLIAADATTTSFNFAGIVVSGSPTGPTTAGNTGSNLTIEGNTIKGGYYSLTLQGNATTPNLGNIVRNNTLVDSYSYGIYAGNQEGAQLIGNDVSRTTRANGGSFYGIYCVGTVRSLAIEKNKIHDTFGASPTSTSVTNGIYISTTGASATTPNDIVNNVLYNLSGNGSQFIIYNLSTAFVRIYNNAINSDNRASTTTSTTYGIYSTGANCEIKNNVVSITRTGSGAKYGLYFTTNVPASNYNDIYVPAGNVGYNNAVYSTLASWQAGSGALDQNSVSADPIFAGAGSLLPSNSQLNGTGTPLARVTDDITGAVRGAAPDMGAYEFTPVATDFAPLGLISPAATSTCYSPAEPVSVQVRNSGATPLNFATNPATVTVVVTPPSGPAQTFATTISTGTLAISASQAITLPGTLNMAAVGTYSFIVTATVTGDLNATNDVLVPAPTRAVLAPVGGTLSPGTASLCVSGTVALSLVGAANGGIQYQSSTSPTGPFTDIAGATAATFTTPVLTTAMYYRARIGCNTSLAYSNVAAITVNNPQLATAPTPLTVCAGTPATLTATATAGNTVRFYSTATGGPALASPTSGSYTTPALQAGATYYAEAYSSLQENVGKPLTDGLDGNNTSGGLYFSTTGAVTITNVTVYSTVNALAGTATIYLLSGSTSSTANPLATATVTLPANTTVNILPTVLTLNFAVPAAGNYTLYLGSATRGLARDYGAFAPPTTYPYTSPSGLVSITGTLLAGTYNYFYNWQINSECANPVRTPIQVNVTPAPTATLTATSQAGGGVLLTATPVAGATYQFFRNNVAVAAASPTNTLLLQSTTLNGSYTVVVSSGGCSSPPSAAVAVTVTGTRTASLNGVSLLVYPNPTPNGYLTLELAGPQAKASQLEVLNVLGQTVHSRTLAPGTTILSLPMLAAGIYTLRVQTEQGILTQRVVRE